MWKTLLIAIALLLASVVLLSISILIKKNGRFPNTHVGKNPAMRKRKIGCVESQDAEAQRISPLAVKERSLFRNYMNFKSLTSIALTAVTLFGFCQCKQQPTAVQPEQTPVPVSGLKIAYIDVDSLLTNYDFYKDLAEAMIRKEENYRLVLAEEASKLQKEIEDFEKKLQNSVYASRERAESEQNRLAKKQQALQEKSQKYSEELDTEGNENSRKISESIDNYIKEYNKTHGYDLIISRSSLMFANESMNITADIIEGLNAAYSSTK